MATALEAIDALRAGRPVVLPTDTVYGLCVSAYTSAAVASLHALKGRADQPVALLASDLEVIFDAVPELRGRTGRIMRALLPGPYTLVLPNPAQRFRWLTAGRETTIGVRVPSLPEAARDVLDRFGAVAATSANHHGEADPARVEDIPEAIRLAAAAVIDAGELPGVPSTVIDFCGPEPTVLREGAAGAAEAIRRALAAAR
jgi:L-threonylcarbamoyladenylate synthase